MEQQYDASGALLAQAARTVLPGEPFDPPARSMVPGPRLASQEPPIQPPTALTAEWNYDPGPPLYSPQVHVPSTTTQVSAQPLGGSDFDALGEYATLPAAPPMSDPGFGKPYQVAPAEPQEYPAYPPPDAPLPPLPPAASHEHHAHYAGKRRAPRNGPDRRLLAAGLVVVLAGGGYTGYTQLTRKSDTTTTPVAPVVTAAPRYDFPANLAGFSLQTGPAASALQRQLRSSAVAAYPTFGKASVASYGPGKPPIIAVSFHPGTAKLSSGYSAVLAGVRKPAKGNLVGAFTAAIPGAAGGQMTCGGQRGVAPISYCVWRGKSTVGMLYIAGTPKTGVTQILTRELRAYAEH